MSDGESPRSQEIRKSRNYLLGIFFLFGFSVMSWIPRFPEVKANMRLTNGQFGTIISVGAIGGIIMLLIGGHIVHRFGTAIVMYASAISYAFATATIIHITSVPLFIFFNVLNGASVSAFHIAINSQALHEQELGGGFIMPRVAGSWSSGALLTIILSGFLASRISLGWHIDVLVGCSLLGVLYLIHKIAPFEIPGTSDPDESSSLTSIIRNFQVNWPVSIGLLMGVQIEFSTGDWATIYSKENLGFSPGIATLPFIFFVAAMISGRFTIHRIARKYPIEKLVVWGGLIGGASFIVGITVSNALHDNLPGLALLFGCIGFSIAGFGSSFMGPTFTVVAKRESNLPGGVVIGHLGVVNNTLTFLVKAIIAWTAQWLSLPIALLIPGVMLMSVSFFAKSAIEESSTS